MRIISAEKIRTFLKCIKLECFFSKKNIDVLDIVEILFYFFCWFPYITLGVFNFGTDMQVYVAGIAVLYLLLYLFAEKKYLKESNRLKKLIFVAKVPILLLCLSVVFIIVALLKNESIFHVLRASYNYVSIFVVSIATYLCIQRHNGLFEKTIKLFCWIWLIVGLVQLLIDRSFLGIIVSGFRTTDNRGVCSLASEPSFYGVVCFFFIIIAQKFKTRKWLYIALSLFQIVFLAQSSVTIVYLGVFFICVLINYIVNSIKNKKFLPLIIVLGVLIICLPILYFVIITFMTGRFPHLIKLAVTNPLALLKDESIIARVNAIIFAVESFFKNFGIPHGFVYEGMPGIRIMSGYGTLLYEMGVFGVILIVSVFRYLFRTFNMAYAITITIVMFSAVQLGLPIFAFLIGFSMYEANAISHNKKITEKSRWYVKRYSYRSEKVKILNDCEP